METYICLLRSVNVSGVNLIKMVDLKAFWESLGFTSVKTYIQSGNIIFSSATTPNATELEKLIENRFNTKNVAVIILTPKELVTIIDHNPFTKLPDFDLKKMYVCYLRKSPGNEALKQLEQLDFGKDSISLGNQVLYIYYGESAGKSKLTNKVLEKHLAVSSTSRNWNTTNKLLALV